jgi:carboxyl-terminal processing protease
MTRIPSPLRTAAAACLLFVAHVSFASEAATPDAAIAAMQSAFARAVPAGQQADFYRELFPTVLERVQRSYATEVDLGALSAAAMKVLDPVAAGAGEPRELFSKAMNAALRTLDPYSRYLDPQARANERESVTGGYGGLGLEVEASQGLVRVVSPMPGSPAARAGVQVGDLIVRVDDQPLQGVALADAIAKMRGAPGTPVALTIRRSGLAEDITVSVQREVVRRQAVAWKMEGDALVVKVSTFTGPVTAALHQAITQATAAHAPRSLVLDLRGNPGGLLREAINIADTFLAKGEIVSLRGRTPGNQRSWQADASEMLPGVPMVVLIDRRSASASELLAAALQDNGRATVMGQRSYGKGTVQSTYGLGDELKGAVKLTSAHYHAPSGRSVQKAGVNPDIELLGMATTDDRPASEAPQGLRAPLARVDQQRCGAVYKSADPALACAIGYLHAGTMDAFVGAVAGQQQP